MRYSWRINDARQTNTEMKQWRIRFVKHDETVLNVRRDETGLFRALFVHPRERKRIDFPRRRRAALFSAP